MNSRIEIKKMDKKVLVEQVKRVIDSFKNEGKNFSFVGLIPVYQNSYILSVSADWLEPFSTYESISIITRRMFELLDSKTIRHLNRVEIYDKNNLLDNSNDLILEDTIGYQNFHNSRLSQHDIMSYMTQ